MTPQRGHGTANATSIANVGIHTRSLRERIMCDKSVSVDTKNYRIDSKMRIGEKFSSIAVDGGAWR
ncbi:hypothetical protein BN903_2 [Halorubrum sp. AJ67]|nr:hypothetical protein BN903_2 [Halorubrum sp. AJ67]